MPVLSYKIYKQKWDAFVETKEARAVLAQLNRVKSTVVINLGVFQIVFELEPKEKFEEQTE